MRQYSVTQCTFPLTYRSPEDSFELPVTGLSHNSDRRQRLLELIRVRGFAALDELVRELGVSESTVRRDLDALEEQGSARRTHGGVLYAGGMPRLAEFDERQPANWAAKRAIAAASRSASQASGRRPSEPVSVPRSPRADAASPRPPCPRQLPTNAASRGRS